MNREIKKIIKNPINDIVDNETFKKIYFALHKEGIRNYGIRRIYKMLRKKYTAGESIMRIKSLYPDLALETLKKAVYGKTVYRYRKMV